MPEKIGPYPVKGHLGGGGQGDVYLGFHPSFEIDVAIKVLNEAFREPEQLERIKVEAQTMVRLSAPNVVRVYDFNLDGPYLVMEYCRGGDLTQYIMNRRRRPLTDILGVVRQVCEALVVAHEHDPPILHRDIKPANVMFHNGVPKVTDFGLAKMLGGGSGLTSTRGPMGTPRYMSPEQLQDASRVDQRTDLWSIGVILYELLTWTRPFDKPGDSYFNIMLRTRTEAPRTPPYDLPEPVLAVILKALEKEPQNRFKSAREMRDALDEALRAVPDAAQLLLPPEHLVDDLSRLSAQVADHIEAGRSQEAHSAIQEICRIAPEDSIGKYWRKRFKATGQSGSSPGQIADSGEGQAGDWAADEIIAIKTLIKDRKFREARQRCGELLAKLPENTVVLGLLDTNRKAEADFRKDLDDAHRAADAARARGAFLAVYETWHRLDGKYPDDRDIKAELVVAEREKEIAEQRQARETLEAEVAERQQAGDLEGAIRALRDHVARFSHDQHAASQLQELEELRRSQMRAERIATLRAETANLRTAGRLPEAPALWEAFLLEDPEAEEAARELQSLRDEIATRERERHLGRTRARAAQLAGEGDLRAALQQWETYRIDYPDDGEAAGEIDSLQHRITEQRRQALQNEIDRLTAELQSRLEGGRYASLAGVGSAAGETLRSARSSPTGDLKALDARRDSLIAIMEQAETGLAAELAARRAQVESRLAELSDWLPAGADAGALRPIPAEQDLRRALMAGLGALCELQSSDVRGDPIERMAAAEREMVETATALARDRQQALDAAQARARSELAGARAAVEALALLGEGAGAEATSAASPATRLEQLQAQVDSKVPERLLAVAGQLNSLRGEAEALLVAARWRLSNDLAGLLEQGRALLTASPTKALQDLIGRAAAALREKATDQGRSDRPLIVLRAELRRELQVASATGQTRLSEARERWQSALQGWREVLAADLGLPLELEGRKIEIAGDTSLATARSDELIGWAAQLEGLMRRYRLESAWIEHANDVLEIEGPLGSDGLPQDELEPAQRKLLADYRKAVAAGDGAASRALGPELKKQAGVLQAGDDRTSADLPPVPPLKKSLRHFNERYAAGNLQGFDELAARYEKSRSRGRGAEASRLEEELEASYRGLLRPPPVWRGPLVQWTGAAALAVAIAWFIVVPPPEPTSVTVLSPAGEVAIARVLRDGVPQEGLGGRITEQGETWPDLQPGHYTVEIGSDRQIEFDVPGQSLVLVPGEKIDYPGILLKELGLENLATNSDER